MNDAPARASKQVNDLIFEIVAERESKFLLLVCDDDEISKQIRETMDKELAEVWKNIVYITASKAADDLLHAFYAETLAERPEVMVLWGLQKLTPPIADAVLRQLNFHRDALAALKVPIVIWLTNELLSRFPGLAPDFWSRRTGIYRFTPQPTRELISRLFSKGKGGASSAHRSDIAKAIDEIRDSERALRKCLRTDSFKVEHPDALMAKIRDNVVALRSQCEGGNPIDVALHLWKLARLDATLERVVGDLSIGERNVFEYLYTDRNEALLFTAQKLPDIFLKYLENIPDRVRKKRRPDLVTDFYQVAIDKLAEIADDLEASIGVSIDQLENTPIDDEHEDDSDFPEPRSTVESTFGAQASYELESWLTGYNDKRPMVFSETEGQFLKLLYSDQGPMKELAKKVGMSVPRVRKEIRRLEEKVHLYLSNPEKERPSLPSVNKSAAGQASPKRPT
jgi:hypothetical protein